MGCIANHGGLGIGSQRSANTQEPAPNGATSRPNSARARTRPSKKHVTLSRSPLAGRLIRVVDNTGTTVYTYDDVGRLTQVAYPGNKTVGYEYDAAGNRMKLTYPDSTYITYEYDVLNRLTKIKNFGVTSGRDALWVKLRSWSGLRKRLDGWCVRRRRGANLNDRRNEHRNEYDVP